MCQREPADAHHLKRVQPNALARKPKASDSKLKKACKWLISELAGGPRRVKELEKLAKSEGLTWRTVENAKEELGIKSQRAGGAAGKGHWVWKLPSSSKTQASAIEETAPLRDEPETRRPFRYDKEARRKGLLARVRRYDEMEHSEKKCA